MASGRRIVQRVALGMAMALLVAVGVSLTARVVMFERHGDECIREYPGGATRLQPLLEWDALRDQSRLRAWGLRLAEPIVVLELAIGRREAAADEPPALAIDRAWLRLDEGRRARVRLAVYEVRRDWVRFHDAEGKDVERIPPLITGP